MIVQYLKRVIVFSVLFMGSLCIAKAQNSLIPKNTVLLKGAYQVRGKGLCSLQQGILSTRDCYAEFGDSTWKDYSFSFSARTPVSEKEVQIWYGFRTYTRDDRYVLGFRGGEQNNIYFARQGYMGTDEFLALRSLDFQPKTGEWYRFTIRVSGNRFQVFINDETLPRIDYIDQQAQRIPGGGIALGGGWLLTEFKDLSVQHETTALTGAVKEYLLPALTTADKEVKRQQQRTAYRPIQLQQLNNTRTTLSLNGQWLFMPGYQLEDERIAVSPSQKDEDWHSMTVPSFWNPIRIWLHGETFGKNAKGVSDVYYKQETDRCANYTFDYKKTSFAWYRQWIELPTNMDGKHAELVFDAVSKVAEVWVNGKKAGEHTGMFGEIRLDVSRYLHAGKNLVVVKVVRDYVKNIADAGKVVGVAVSVEVTNKMLKDLAHGFYGDDPAGIWQPVRLEITNPLNIADVFIKPGLTGASYDVTIANHSKKDQFFYLVTEIREQKNGALLSIDTTLLKSRIGGNKQQVFSCASPRLQPKLWSPEAPNLYMFHFHLVSALGETDKKSISSGFRTFESKQGFLWLNGKRYWLRGGNHTPFALAPDDRELADTFMLLMKRAHIDVTRTHTAPWNELWMEAADRNGIGISYEGTWPWLMLGTSMPDQKLIDLWADEFISLLKKYRNHPSLLLWTVNNEMKFYDAGIDPDTERAKLKMTIISDVVKRMREVDPTRPVVFDSNYKRKIKRFGAEFYKSIDDGDIDDPHAYINWYDHTLFKQFNGEFQFEKNVDRPLISQEMSTGYPNNETGHATRFYTIAHQTGQSLVGNLAYENADPRYFMEAQSFITGELAEALRRSNDSASGILHFALLTWFQKVHDAKAIRPWPTYYAIQRALSPVLVSAELWGRHFYAGSKLPVRVCVVNDRENGETLQATTLTWKLEDAQGKQLATGTQAVPAVVHYGRQWVMPDVVVPATLPNDREEAQLVFTLTENGKNVSTNTYKIMLANKTWVQFKPGVQPRRIMLVDYNRFKNVLDFVSVPTQPVNSVAEVVQQKADLYIFSGLQLGVNCQEKDIQLIRQLMDKGARILLLSSETAARAIFPESITGWVSDDEGDISNLDIPESPVFEDIAPLDMRYFNNNKREIPLVCTRSLQINRKPTVTALASHIKIHGYLAGDMPQHEQKMKTLKGFPVVTINERGKATISTLLLEKAITDPVAGKLLQNMINDLMEDIR